MAVREISKNRTMTIQENLRTLLGEGEGYIDAAGGGL
jgi:hypothetical protein